MKKEIVKTALAAMLVLGIFTSGWTQEHMQVMLVLDASGSMWKRVDDKEKILIAREVVSDILKDWDPNTDLGLIAYGHRRKGDCNDIETLVPLGPAGIDAVRHTVSNIQPKGKTPLSAAVRKAAQELRYTEERATVILISDGKETCNMDPCALGRELEEAGVDFTAHVIGFDIADDERAQLQCLAQATGGRYFDARKAEELKVALAEAVKEVQVETTRARLEAADTAPAGASIEVAWDGPDSKNDYISVAAPEEPDRRYANYAYTRNGSPAQLLMPDKPGVYELRYVSGQSRTALARQPITVTEITASLDALDLVSVEKPIQIEWQGPDNKNDYLAIAETDSPDNKYIKYVYTRNGNPARLQMPDHAGVYELRYVTGQSKRVLARQPIKVVLEEELPQGGAAGVGEVLLQVVDASTGEPVLKGLSWMVYSLQGGAQEIHRAIDARPRFALRPGRYRAVVNSGSLSQTLDFNLNGGESVTHTISFRAPQ